MRKACLFLLLVLLLAGLDGCAGARAYFADRGRDFGDMLTLTVGTGAGFKARVGPLNTSLFFSRGDLLGIRNGSVSCPSLADSGTSQAAEFFVVGSERTPLGEQRGKSFFAVNAFLFEVPELKEPYPIEFFTQIEAALGLGFFIRLGVNPGEILDFILGWTTLDMFGDDVGVEDSRADSTSTPEE